MPYYQVQVFAISSLHLVPPLPCLCCVLCTCSLRLPRLAAWALLLALFLRRSSTVLSACCSGGCMDVMQV